MILTVAPATAAELTTASRLLAADRSGPDRDLTAAHYSDLFSVGELDSAGLMLARDASGVARGAMLVQALGGALGLAWAPQAEAGRDRSAIEDALVREACAWLRRHGVRVCQSYSDQGPRPGLAALERHGFDHVTEVIHLRRDADDVAIEPASGLVFEAVTPASRGECAAVLVATHDGSLDCPELTGDRTADELLDAFPPLTDRPVPSWHLVRHGRAPVGAVLVDPHVGPDEFELSYIGLVPSARGRGWGRRLVEFALSLAPAAGADTVATTVDARNDYALRLYRELGFTEFDRRDVHLAHWPRER